MATMKSAGTYIPEIPRVNEDIADFQQGDSWLAHEPTAWLGRLVASQIRPHRLEGHVDRQLLGDALCRFTRLCRNLDDVTRRQLQHVYRVQGFMLDHELTCNAHYVVGMTFLPGLGSYAFSPTDKVGNEYWVDVDKASVILVSHQAMRRGEEAAFRDGLRVDAFKFWLDSQGWLRVGGAPAGGRISSNHVMWRDLEPTPTPDKDPAGFLSRYRVPFDTALDVVSALETNILCDEAVQRQPLWPTVWLGFSDDHQYDVDETPALYRDVQVYLDWWAAGDQETTPVIDEQILPALRDWARSDVKLSTIARNYLMSRFVLFKMQEHQGLYWLPAGYYPPSSPAHLPGCHRRAIMAFGPELLGRDDYSGVSPHVNTSMARCQILALPPRAARFSRHQRLISLLMARDEDQLVDYRLIYAAQDHAA